MDLGNDQLLTLQKRRQLDLASFLVRRHASYSILSGIEPETANASEYSCAGSTKDREIAEPHNEYAISNI